MRLQGGPELQWPVAAQAGAGAEAPRHVGAEAGTGEQCQLALVAMAALGLREISGEMGDRKEKPFRLSPNSQGCQGPRTSVQ